MYKYNELDQKIVDERCDQYRDQTRRHLAGTLPEEEFRPLRLMNGLYKQIHAPMLRVAVPYGMLSSQQLRKLAHIARTYDRGYGHFSTRQNIQFNWPKLEQVPDILNELATVQMHAIQTSGNCIRNTTADHLAGIAPDEIEDPRPYCEIIRQWSTFHPEFSYLPRKFKIAVTGAREDRAAVALHDIGLYLVRNQAGDVGFKVLVGGGQGRTPIIGVIIREFLDKAYLLSYLEAILRIYNLFGRRDNKYKARIKILVSESGGIGKAKFTELVESEWRRIRDQHWYLKPDEIERFQAHFTPPEYASEPANAADDDASNAKDLPPLFAAWLKQNVKAHRVDGYRIVYVSLKAPDMPPGDITDQQMDALAALADRFSMGEIRSTHAQNLVLGQVKATDLHALWEGLDTSGLATPNIGLLTDMICCPGLDFCSLANASSIPVAREINQRFASLDELHDLGEIDIKISGCINACGHHHVGHIGILGVDKRGEEFYQLTLGGAAGNQSALGERLGRAIERQRVIDVIAQLLDVYVAERRSGERFLDTYQRIGIMPFRVRVYGEEKPATPAIRGAA